MSILPDGFRLMAIDLYASSLEAVKSAITWEQRTVRVFGREVAVPRLTSWMGTDAYTYSGISHEPAAMPPVVAELHAAIETATGARFNSVLANYYRDGSDSVAWHADDEPELGAEPVIASLSLGASRTFAIRPNADHSARQAITLSHGDLLVMSGASQRDYQHAIPKTKRPIGPRINLTFRAVTK